MYGWNKSRFWGPSSTEFTKSQSVSTFVYPQWEYQKLVKFEKRPFELCGSNGIWSKKNNPEKELGFFRNVGHEITIPKAFDSSNQENWEPSIMLT